MADEPTTTTDAATGSDTGKKDDAAPAAGSDKTFTQAQLDAIVQDRLTRERQKTADYEDLKSKAEKYDQLEESQKSDLEKLTGERDTLKSERDSFASKALRLEVAVEKGLVGDKAKLADRLQGSTKEELAADADELLKLVGPGEGKTDADAGDGNTAPGMDGGARTSKTTPTEAEQLAAIDAYSQSHVPGLEPAAAGAKT